MSAKRWCEGDCGAEGEGRGKVGEIKVLEIINSGGGRGGGEELD